MDQIQMLAQSARLAKESPGVVAIIMTVVMIVLSELTKKAGVGMFCFLAAAYLFMRSGNKASKGPGKEDVSLEFDSSTGINGKINIKVKFATFFLICGCALFVLAAITGNDW